MTLIVGRLHSSGESALVGLSSQAIVGGWVKDEQQIPSLRYEMTNVR